MASSSSSSSVGQGPNQRQPEHFEWLIVTEKKRGHVVYSVEMHHRMTGTTAVHAIRKAFKDTKPSNPWFHSRAQLEDVVLSSVSLLLVRTLPILRRPTYRALTVYPSSLSTLIQKLKTTLAPSSSNPAPHSLSSSQRHRRHSRPRELAI
jgi:hypothetical protein